MDNLDAPALRYRIVQLAAEMQERTKWEALRLKEFMSQAEKSTAEKYTSLMQEQRLKFEEVRCEEAIFFPLSPPLILT